MNRAVSLVLAALALLASAPGCFPENGGAEELSAETVKPPEGMGVHGVGGAAPEGGGRKKETAN